MAYVPESWVEWDLRITRVQQTNGCVSQLDGDSDMVASYACMLGRRQSQQRNNGFCQLLCPEESCLSSPHPESRQLSSPVYFPVTSLGTAPVLELRATDSVSE